MFQKFKIRPIYVTILLVDQCGILQEYDMILMIKAGAHGGISSIVRNFVDMLRRNPYSLSAWKLITYMGEQCASHYEQADSVE
jgi:hypothetical protein